MIISRNMYSVFTLCVHNTESLAALKERAGEGGDRRGGLTGFTKPRLTCTTEYECLVGIGTDPKKL